METFCARMWHVFQALALLTLVSLPVTYGQVNVISTKGVHIMNMSDTCATFGPPLPVEGLDGVVNYVVPHDACSDDVKPGPRYENLPWIALIARGNCDFDKKVFNVQKAGYSGAIIHNYPGHNSSFNLDPSSGYAKHLHISSVSVGYSHGMELAYTYNYQNTAVTVQIMGSPGRTYMFIVWTFVGICCTGCMSWVVYGVNWKCNSMKERREILRAAEKLPRRKYKKGDQYDMCVICLEDYTEGEEVRVLVCKHTYHKECINPWLGLMRKTCPQCKRQVLFDNMNSVYVNETTPLLPARDRGVTLWSASGARLAEGRRGYMVSASASLQGPRRIPSRRAERGTNTGTSASTSSSTSSDVMSNSRVRPPAAIPRVHSAQVHRSDELSDQEATPQSDRIGRRASERVVEVVVERGMSDRQPVTTTSPPTTTTPPRVMAVSVDNAPTTTTTSFTPTTTRTTLPGDVPVCVDVPSTVCDSPMLVAGNVITSSTATVATSSSSHVVSSSLSNVPAPLSHVLSSPNVSVSSSPISSTSNVQTLNVTSSTVPVSPSVRSTSSPKHALPSPSSVQVHSAARCSVPVSSSSQAQGPSCRLTSTTPVTSSCAATQTPPTSQPLAAVRSVSRLPKSMAASSALPGRSTSSNPVTSPSSSAPQAASSQTPPSIPLKSLESSSKTAPPKRSISSNSVSSRSSEARQTTTNQTPISRQPKSMAASPSMLTPPEKRTSSNPGSTTSQSSIPTASVASASRLPRSMAASPSMPTPPGKCTSSTPATRPSASISSQASIPTTPVTPTSRLPRSMVTSSRSVGGLSTQSTPGAAAYVGAAGQQVRRGKSSGGLSPQSTAETQVQAGRRVRSLRGAGPSAQTIAVRTPASRSQDPSASSTGPSGAFQTAVPLSSSSRLAAALKLLSASRRSGPSQSTACAASATSNSSAASPSSLTPSIFSGSTSSASKSSSSSSPGSVSSKSLPSTSSLPSSVSSKSSSSSSSPGSVSTGSSSISSRSTASKPSSTSPSSLSSKSSSSSSASGSPSSKSS